MPSTCIDALCPSQQGLKYLKIGTCPASQKLLAYMGKKLIYTRNIKIFTCPAARGTRKYERTSAIFEAWLTIFQSERWNQY